MASQTIRLPDSWWFPCGILGYLAAPRLLNDP